MAYSQMMSSGYFFADERLSDNLYEGRGSTDEKLITSGQANAALGRFSEDWKNVLKALKHATHSWKMLIVSPTWMKH